MAEQDFNAVLRTAALERVKELDPNRVLADLKENGITSLEELVTGVLEHYRAEEAGTGSPVAYDTFIYEQFVYKVAMPVDDLQKVVSQAIREIPSDIAVERHG